MSHPRKSKQKHVYGAWRFPDGLNTNDFEWSPIGQVKAECRLEHERLKEMWARLWEAKRQIDADWHAEQNERVRLIGLLVDRDRQAQELEDEERLLLEYHRKEQLEGQALASQMMNDWLAIERRLRMKRHKKIGRKIRTEDAAAAKIRIREQLRARGASVPREVTI